MADLAPGQGAVVVQVLAVLVTLAICGGVVGVCVAIGSTLDRRQARRLAQQYRNHR